MSEPPTPPSDRDALLEAAALAAHHHTLPALEGELLELRAQLKLHPTSDAAPSIKKLLARHIQARRFAEGIDHKDGAAITALRRAVELLALLDRALEPPPRGEDPS